MAKVDIFSGFLGAGKTTLIKKLIQEAYQGEKLVLIENEFGEIGIDGGFLQDAGLEITEMNSGCICCSMVGDFGETLQKVLEQFHPDRILIEPSGVGKLSDVIQAVQNIHSDALQLNAFVTIADAGKCKMYMKNFGEFYNNQIENAATIILSRTDKLSQQKLLDCIQLLRQHNSSASIITTPWSELSGAQILKTMEDQETLQKELDRLAVEHMGTCPVCGEHHDEHVHHHDLDNHVSGHQHHQHQHEHDSSYHHQHHDEKHSCSCGCHHHADEIFTSWGVETPRKYSEEEVTVALTALGNEGAYGTVLRAKGMVPCADGTWLHFDYVPGELELRKGGAGVIGRLCVIGAQLKQNELANLFYLG